MRFKDVFSIIGPAMVGPSSSHTAGAVRLGRVARQCFGELPDQAEITFYGSFAETHQGHGTDVAVLAGIMDFSTDDSRIPSAFEEAEKAGIAFEFKTAQGQSWHPNTAKIKLLKQTKELVLIGSSIGGGNIEVKQVNEFQVEFSGMYPTLVIFHADRPGMIADVTEIFRHHKLNIGHMDVDRNGRSKDAITVIESDQHIGADVQEAVSHIGDVKKVVYIQLNPPPDAMGKRRN